MDKVRQSKGNEGFDALTLKYTDLVAAGIIDPTKVVRTALANELVTKAQIDGALATLLRTRFRLGLFDPSTPYDGLRPDIVGSEKHARVARRAFAGDTGRSWSRTEAAMSPKPDAHFGFVLQLTAAAAAILIAISIGISSIGRPSQRNLFADDFSMRQASERLELFREAFLDYLRPDFHPDDHDDYELAREYLESVGAPV